MKKSLNRRLRHDLFPKMPQSFADKLSAALPKEQVERGQTEATLYEPEKFRLRFWQTLAVTSLSLLTAACLLFAVFSAFWSRRWDTRDAVQDSVAASPTQSVTATDAPVAPHHPEEDGSLIVGKWTLWKIDYNGLIVSASVGGAGMLYTLELRDDGTADLQANYTAKTTYAYTFDGGAVTLSAEGEDDVVLTYDAEADTLTAQKKGDGAKLILRREIPEEPAKPSAIGKWYRVTGLDMGIDITIRDDGTATVSGWRGNAELPFTYTEEDGELQFTCVSEMTHRTFTARYDEERDVLVVTMDGTTVDYHRPNANPEGVWTLTGVDYNGTVTDTVLSAYGLQMYLAFSDDGAVTVTIFMGSEGDSQQFRYLVTGNRIELTAIDAEDMNSVPISKLVYDPQTDTLRLEYDTTAMAYDMALIFSRTPDAVIPEIPEVQPDLVGKWTVTEVQMDGQTVDPSMLGGEFSMWLELRPDGSATLTGLSDADGIEQDGQYTVTGNTVVITDENGDPLTLTYDPATDTLYVEHTYSDYGLTLGLRFARTPDAEIPELPREELVELKEDYPEYFGLDASKGLKVYVWQMSGESYSCALLAGSDNKTEAEISRMKGTTIEEMRLILNTYEIEDNDIDVEVVPFRNPLSSYWYEIDKDYTDHVTWLSIGVSEAWIDDAEIYDVDGDGQLETCELWRGPTSGLYTAVLTVTRNGTVICQNTFKMAPYLWFVWKDGSLMIKWKSQDSGQETYYRITIENGAVVLTDTKTGDTVEYWDAEDPEWNMAVAERKSPAEMLEGLWCALWVEQGDFGLGGTGDGDGLLRISFYRDGDEQYASFLKDGVLYDGYSYTVKAGERNEWKTDNPWYSFTFTKGDEVLELSLEMDKDGKEPIEMDLFRELYPEEGKGGWLSYLKRPVIEADELPMQESDSISEGEGYIDYLDVVDLNGDGNPVRVKVASSNPNWYIDKGEKTTLTVQIGRGKWTVNEVFVWDSLIYADLDPNDGHGNVLVSAKRADGTVVTYELHPEGDKVVCGHVAEGECMTLNMMYEHAASTEIYLSEKAPLGSVDGIRRILGEDLQPESDWWTVLRITYSSHKDRDWLVQHGELLHLIRDLPCEIDGKSAVLEAGTYLYLSRYHEGLDRIELLTEDNRTVLIRPDAGLLLDGVPLADYFEKIAEE